MHKSQLAVVLMNFKVPVDIREFLEREAAANISSLNAEAVRGLREVMNRRRREAAREPKARKAAVG